MRKSTKMLASIVAGMMAVGGATVAQSTPAFPEQRGGIAVGQTATPVQYHNRGWGNGYGRGHHGGGWGRGVGPFLGGLAAGAIIGGAVQGAGAGAYGSDDAYARCAAQYRSFDPQSGTYTTYGGETVLCPYLR